MAVVDVNIIRPRRQARRDGEIHLVGVHIKRICSGGIRGNERCVDGCGDGRSTRQHQVNPTEVLRGIGSIALRQVLAECDPREAELLRAIYVDQRPLRELAAESDQTYKALESRLARLRQKLKSKLLSRLRHENRS